MAKTSTKPAICKDEDFLSALVLEAFRAQPKTSHDIRLLKYQFCERYKKQKPPANIDLITTYQKLIQKGELTHDSNFIKLLRKRAVRTLSGIAPLAVLTKPYKCPGTCIFCPTERNMPKSYLSNEPAAMRAVVNKFNPFHQVKARLQAFEKEGHATDKIELIVLGGTFSFLPVRYQTWFIKQCFDAMNGEKSRSLEEAQIKNEKALHRCIGLTLETRPDYCTEKEMQRFRALGCTRVEIGVQTTDDRINDLNKRGHHKKEVYAATKRLKDAGFKVCYHMMPGLYGSTPKKDLESMKEIFKNEKFRPDLIKIYPCVVMQHTQLEKLWREGKYRPYNDEQLGDILIKIKKIIPPYVRVNRIIREFPAESVLAGTKLSNFRQVLQKKLKKEKVECQCIRCREIKAGELHPKNIKYVERTYKASGGREFFLSYEDVKRNKLIAMLRLRFPAQLYIPEIKSAALIRELHTYGQELPIDTREKGAAQHLGFGKKLMKRAERIAKKEGYKKIAVIAGIGVRPYYKKIGYRLEGTYMTKTL